VQKLLHEEERCPTRRTSERRLAALPARLPGQIGYSGRHLVTQLQSWAGQGRAAALDRTPLRTGGGVWHKKQRETGEIRIGLFKVFFGWPQEHTS
jgi:hypothetical protein